MLPSKAFPLLFVCLPFAAAKRKPVVEVNLPAGITTVDALATLVVTAIVFLMVSKVRVCASARTSGRIPDQICTRAARTDARHGFD